jgi:hypothetical protein
MEVTKATYNWKSFSIGGYKEMDSVSLTFHTDGVNFKDILPHFENTDVIHHFFNQYSSFTIAKQSKVLIDELIKFYKLETDSINLYALSAILQNEYSYYYDNPINTAKGEFKDVEFLHLELKSLFDLVEIHLNNESLENFESITFKIGGNRQAFVFESFFIFRDLMEAFINAHNIDKDNFERVKHNLLSQTVNVKHENLSDYHKQKYIIGLYSYIAPNQKPDSNNLRFIACFLLLSQIPVSSMADEITIPSNPKDVSHSDVTTLRKYVVGEKDFSHKKLKR